ncbi:unnamed protein product [Fraxinus pennsylvanica]|uniref:Uncharacterized protein n=1 Tax=Fraxinus pennsylvanica TaxID=56036 RepID=A0AAD1ZC40_9LAMI|nr:unnamed protein product [Fraxinus pennsylvanica]
MQYPFSFLLHTVLPPVPSVNVILGTTSSNPACWNGFIETEVPANIRQGTLISFVPEFVNHVLHDKSLYQKGYDASGENDEEKSDELEFSDDEKEVEYRRMLKMKKRGTNDPKLGTKKKDKKQFKNRSGNWNCNQKFT